jgi:PiT family inorganic phosphate transporter
VLRIVSLGMMAMAYGSNGGQKTLGLMALALSVLGRPTGASGGWVLLLLSGSAMLIGMMAGSQRTLNTVGRRFYRLQDGQAFCAEITSMALLSASSLAGIPMSSSHLVSASIIGAGVSLRPRGVRWGLVGEMGLAWLVTIPAAGLVSFALARAFQWMAYVVS